MNPLETPVQLLMAVAVRATKDLGGVAGTLDSHQRRGGLLDPVEAVDNEEIVFFVLAERETVERRVTIG